MQLLAKIDLWFWPLGNLIQGLTKIVTLQVLGVMLGRKVGMIYCTFEMKKKNEAIKIKSRETNTLRKTKRAKQRTLSVVS